MAEHRSTILLPVALADLSLKEFTKPKAELSLHVCNTSSNPHLDVVDPSVAEGGYFIRFKSLSMSTNPNTYKWRFCARSNA